MSDFKIYFVRSGMEGPVKIGLSKDPAKRVGDLQVGSWEELILIRTIKNADLGDEKWLHYHFREFLIRGEWFDFTPKMLSVRLPKKGQRREPLKRRSGGEGIYQREGRWLVKVKGKYVGIYCTLDEATWARDLTLNFELRKGKLERDWW